MEDFIVLEYLHKIPKLNVPMGPQVLRYDESLHPDNCFVSIGNRIPQRGQEIILENMSETYLVRIVRTKSRKHAYMKRHFTYNARFSLQFDPIVFWLSDLEQGIILLCLFIDG